MKRDLDLIITILEHLEARNGSDILKVVPIDGFDDATITYHQILIDDAGLAACERIVSSSTPSRVVVAYPFDLTWKGHEFLAATRQKAVWSQLKKHFGKNLKEAPIDTLFDVAMKLGKGYAEKKIAPLLGLEDTK